jgi:hypothetical protein
MRNSLDAQYLSVKRRVARRIALRLEPALLSLDVIGLAIDHSISLARICLVRCHAPHVAKLERATDAQLALS